MALFANEGVHNEGGLVQVVLYTTDATCAGQTPAQATGDDRHHAKRTRTLPRDDSHTPADATDALTDARSALRTYAPALAPPRRHPPTYPQNHTHSAPFPIAEVWFLGITSRQSLGT